MIPKSIHPSCSDSFFKLRSSKRRDFKREGSELDASLPYGSDDVKEKTYASPETIASKVSEWKLQASVRASDLNSRLNAEDVQDPKPKGTARNLEWMVSVVKEKKPVEGNSTFKDYDKGSMKKSRKPRLDANSSFSNSHYWKADFFQQLLEPGIGAQWFEFQISFQEGNP
jgi:hypothetical protein